MLVTSITKHRLNRLREARDMRKAGWEFVDEQGGSLWEIHRGCRFGQRIVEAKPSWNGMGIWVRIEKPAA